MPATRAPAPLDRFLRPRGVGRATRRLFWKRFPLLLTLPMLWPTGLWGQRPSDVPHPPPYYAIQNARVVTGTGAVIDRGTVVIERGLIRAVGTDVRVPAEAWVIEGEGLTVYPGLVDPLSTLGLAAAAEGEGASEGAGRGSPASRQEQAADGPEDRPATTPWRRAADELNAEDARIETWREGGYTTALSVFDEGIVAGQGAVIALAGEPASMVVKAPAALRLNLRPPGGFRSFPGSLMGVVAYLKQLFEDAERYALAVRAYESAPAGRERPAYDRTLEPIHRAVTEGWPVLVPANEPKEIRRALRLARELGIRPVLYGAQGAYEVADELAAAGAAVLVNVKWPERSGDVDPESEESLRALALRANAPGTPAALHEAGVRFALYSGGLGTPRQVLDNVRKAIEEGLPADAALRALTRTPAEIYGVEDRLGSIEAGKIAHLIVTDGDLFAEGTKVKIVFVDGRKFEKAEAERPQAPPAGDLSGTWTLRMQSPRGEREVTVELQMAEDGSLSGTVRGPQGESPITEGWVSGERFSFTVLASRGGRSVESTYTGTFEGGEMKGTVSFGRFTLEFTGSRPEEGEGGVR